jgi:hypothetical protein
VTQLPHLEFGFKKLANAGYDKTSDPTDFFPAPGAYNCIGWAAHDPHHWWWPSPYEYWPFWISPREATVFCFVKTFRWFGYRICDNSRQEFGFEKVALYAIHNSGHPQAVPSSIQDLHDNWTPTHMARQLPDGSWTSKCGPNEDITHYTLDALESYGLAYGSGDEYGRDVLYMKRFILVSLIVRALQHVNWRVQSARSTIREKFRRNSI